MKPLYLVLAVILAGCGRLPSHWDALQAIRSSHHLRSASMSCSGTAIQSHAILTATHCLVGGGPYDIDGKPVSVQAQLNDAQDHTILVIDQTLGHYVGFGPEPSIGDPVFIFGNPGVLTDQYRVGYKSGEVILAGRQVMSLDINGYYGDSGSGIFDDHGRLVGVISVLIEQGDDTRFKLMGAYPLRFSHQQLIDAGVE